MNFRKELYYITPIANITSIMQHGLLSNEKVEALPHASVAMQLIQERRDNVRIPHGLKLHQYVNLYFDARNPMMYKRKDQVNNICVLVISSDVLQLNGVVIADRNASSGYVSFKPSPAGLLSLDFNAIYCDDWTDPDEFCYFYKKSTKCAEVLVPHCIIPQYVTRAYVGNHVAEDKLQNAGFSLTIIVNPKMFFME